MEAFTVRRIIESDLDDFRKLRLEALRLHPEAFGASYEECMSVVTTNRAAYALYRSFGFSEWATDTAALCVDGEFHDEFLMRRDS
ncbi:TPA: hypothetical protein ACGJN3_003626 [Klebsiella aerogenes]